ncbi:hypothetical protein G3I59_36445 [Amycolatopsis rubida]|uniref:Uncharacterized protein n=1 Tax=Amycolatopsis rubida TaxID=112413 RepID=A0ABX0C2Z2_9PSEU|nr:MULTISPECIES: hypothetical protein [Amycolatopsis]MYW95954.1 hypothetical protein [Amycolatopsis rubida]NEC60944.1 hypothetical protein [Amycolatopsis rubida]
MLSGDLLVEDLLDLLEKPSDDAVEARQLGRGAGAVTSGGVGVSRAKSPMLNMTPSS